MNSDSIRVMFKCLIGFLRTFFKKTQWFHVASRLTQELGPFSLKAISMSTVILSTVLEREMKHLMRIKDVIAFQRDNATQIPLETMEHLLYNEYRSQSN